MKTLIENDDLNNIEVTGVAGCDEMMDSNDKMVQDIDELESYDLNDFDEGCKPETDEMIDSNDGHDEIYPINYVKREEEWRCACPCGRDDLNDSEVTFVAGTDEMIYSNNETVQELKQLNDFDVTDEAETGPMIHSNSVRVSQLDEYGLLSRSLPFCLSQLGEYGLLSRSLPFCLSQLGEYGLLSRSLPYASLVGRTGSAKSTLITKADIDMSLCQLYSRAGYYPDAMWMKDSFDIFARGSGLKGIDYSSSKSKGGRILKDKGRSSMWIVSPGYNSNGYNDWISSYLYKGRSGHKAIGNASSTGKGGTGEEDAEASIRRTQSPTEESYKSKEFRELEETITCKVCLDADINIVFLPCRHMATCKRCASALQRCPICRSDVETNIDVNYD